MKKKYGYNPPHHFLLPKTAPPKPPPKVLPYFELVEPVVEKDIAIEFCGFRCSIKFQLRKREK